jgi:hypothetical protein
MAGIYGVCRTASTLGVDYYSLKRRLQENAAAGPDAGIGGNAEKVAAFLELPAVQTGAAECLLELEDADGAKMRIHLKGVATADLAALGRSLWRREP